MKSVQSFRFPRKFPQNGGSEGGIDGTVRNYSRRPRNARPCCKRRVFVDRFRVSTSTPVWTRLKTVKLINACRRRQLLGQASHAPPHLLPYCGFQKCPARTFDPLNARPLSRCYRYHAVSFGLVYVREKSFGKGRER